ncbi:MAG: NUDIX domain-containing protein [Candidatus Omnitrophica bacterium]|nr:NUDIX domain-containing protein [Candidatus Omnitrophota bacterium]
MADSYIANLRTRIGAECIHVPGVRAIILNNQGEVLLQRRTDMDLWGLPVGAVELDETAQEAVRREVLEETGIVVQTIEPMALHTGPSQRFQYPNGDQVQGFAITFIIRSWTGRPEADGVEGSDLRFWPVESLPPDMVPIHAQTLNDYMTYRGNFIVSHYSTLGDKTE